MAKHYLQLNKILKKFLYDRRMNPSELARKVDLPTPTVHRLVTGKSTRPYQSSLEPIAAFFSVTVKQLIGEEPLPEGNISNPVENGSRNIPLISWETILPNDTFVLESTKKIPFIGEIRNNAFATVLPDTSMEPLFSKNSILIIDPGKTIKDRSYVLIHLASTQTLVFRQILIDADQKYLKALNSDLKELQMRLLGKDDRIIGTLVESRMNFES